MGWNRSALPLERRSRTSVCWRHQKCSYHHMPPKMALGLPLAKCLMLAGDAFPKHKRFHTNCWEAEDRLRCHQKIHISIRSLEPKLSPWKCMWLNPQSDPISSSAPGDHLSTLSFDNCGSPSVPWQANESLLKLVMSPFLTGELILIIQQGRKHWVVYHWIISFRQINDKHNYSHKLLWQSLKITGVKMMPSGNASQKWDPGVLTGKWEIMGLVPAGTCQLRLALDVDKKFCQVKLCSCIFMLPLSSPIRY